MSGKWTKGPWGGDPRKPTDIPISGQYETGISLGFVMGDEARMTEGQANARLIAAAPDLAEVAAHPQWSVAMGALQAWSGEGSDASAALAVIGQALRILDDAARDALLKATGE